MDELFENKFDFTGYSVLLRNHSLTYIIQDAEYKTISYTIPTYFDITIDQVDGKIQINFIDRFGSEMTFIHYQPSDLKGMFDFIGRGYRVSDHLKRHRTGHSIMDIFESITILNKESPLQLGSLDGG